MRRLIEAQFERVKPLFVHGGRFQRFFPLYEMGETFFLGVDDRTKTGAHVRDRMDMKRLMIFVWFALLPCVLVGMWNIGNQAYLAEGMADAGLLTRVLRGAWHMLPIIIVSYVVGGFWEIVFAVVRKHEINEGFLVTAILFPLTLAPTTPLWMVAMGISFGVVIGKEVFGGVGMNVLNPALTARAFVFFSYPAAISGAKQVSGKGVWDVATTSNPLVSRAAELQVDAYTGATPLLEVSGAERGADAVAVLNAADWSFMDLFLGGIPGSMGEVSAAAALLGALFLVVTGIASWRIMVACLIGLVGTALAFNAVAGPDSLAFMSLPPHYHIVMGGFAFGAVFMATDPVSAASTNLGKWIYGIAIGALVVVVRVVNPAYPEGMMLAILFMNVFAPLIDYYVIRQTTRRRARRMAAA
jgi:Na+-transporting NADH:ubiquinone oxidoreductase subunit B